VLEGAFFVGIIVGVDIESREIDSVDVIDTIDRG